MPANYEEKTTAVSGRGLYTTRELKAGALVFQDQTLFVAVLDSPILTGACSWCFVYVEEASSSETPVSVSACNGCKIVRYCGKACQTASWKHSHKLECKIFKSLYPSVLPNTARMILQILLRRKNNLIDEAEWWEFLKLQHHMDDLQKGAREGNAYHQQTLENVQLMARAGIEYSASIEKPGFVESLVGRLTTNTLTLTSPLLSPIGLVLSLTGSLANHSCQSNSVITYSGRTLSFRVLDNLQVGTQLNISYVTTTSLPGVRQADLQNRYHFLCECNYCTKNPTPNPPDLTGTPFSSTTARAQFQAEIDTLLSEAKSLPMSKRLIPTAKAWNLFSAVPKYPPNLSPLYQLRFDLIASLQANKFYVAAFIQSLIVQFQVLPVVYPQVAHPARIVRNWVHAKLASQVGALVNDPDFVKEYEVPEEGEIARAMTTKYGIDWGLVVYCLVKDISDHILKSHGVDSPLSIEVGKEMGQLRKEAKQTRGEPSATELDGTRQSLRLISNEGWTWWKTRMREKRSGQIGIGDAEDAVAVLIQ